MSVILSVENSSIVVEAQYQQLGRLRDCATQEIGKHMWISICSRLIGVLGIRVLFNVFSITLGPLREWGKKLCESI